MSTSVPDDLTITDDIVPVVAPVYDYIHQNLTSVASGFFFSHDQQKYFITNRHVVLDEDDDHYPAEIQIKLHVDSNDL